MTRPGRPTFPPAEELRNAELGGQLGPAFGAGRTQSSWRCKGCSATRTTTPRSRRGAGPTLPFGQRHRRKHPARHAALYLRSPALMLEGGLEGAYNFLNGHSSFVSNGAPIVLPGANPRSMKSAARPLCSPAGRSRPTGRWKPARGWNIPPSRHKAFPRAASSSSSRACC